MHRGKPFVFSIISILGVLFFCARALAITDYTGWWWEGEDRTGTGVSIEDQWAGRLYLCWYGYDQEGRPVWYASLMLGEDGQYHGDLGRYTGWPLTGNDPSQGYAGEVLGEASITFSAPDAAVLSYDLDGIDYAKTLTRYWSGEADPRLLHGWWYDPAYEGMGLFVEAREGRLFSAWYHYRDDQSPRWWISTGDFPEQAIAYDQPMLEYSGGQTLSGEYVTPAYEGEKGGALLEFANESRATMQWQGITYNLERFVFGYPYSSLGRIETDNLDYPNMMTVQTEAILLGSDNCQAALYNRNGYSSWARVEEGTYGPLTYLYSEDYVAVSEVLPNSKANLAILDPDGNLSTVSNIYLDRYYTNYTLYDILDEYAGQCALPKLEALAEVTRQLVSRNVDTEALPLQVIGEGVVWPGVSLEELGPECTVINVSACDGETTGRPCADILAEQAQGFAQAFDLYAAAQALALQSAVNAVETLPDSAAKTLVPDTGISQCYDATAAIACPEAGEAFYGQDAQYTPVDLQPSYTDNEDGTVTDNVTGLMWMQGYAEGHESRYEAANYCADLEQYGYADWRLPDMHELFNLMDKGRSNPAINPVFDCPSGYFWVSNTPQGSVPGTVWMADFAEGGNTTFMSTSFFSSLAKSTRCVRTPGSNRSSQKGEWQ